MKRVLSSSSSDAISGGVRQLHGAPLSQRPKVDHDSEPEGHEEQRAFFLKHQNKALAGELLQYRRTVADLERRLAATQRSQSRCDATLSLLSRAWQVLDDDLTQAARAAGVTLPLPPLPAAAAAAGAASSSAVASSAGASSRDTAMEVEDDGGGGRGSNGRTVLEQDLLAALDSAMAADLPGASATLLNGNSGRTSPHETASSNGDAGGGAAGGDAREGGGGEGGGGEAAVLAVPDHLRREWTERDSLLAPPHGQGTPRPAVAGGKKRAEALLKEKTALTQRVFRVVLDALARHFGSSLEGTKRATLSQMHAQLLADRRRLTAEAAQLRGQLRAEARRASELRAELLVVKHQCHKANRKLDVLAAEGVVIPKDNVVGGAPAAAATPSGSAKETEPGTRAAGPVAVASPPAMNGGATPLRHAAGAAAGGLSSGSLGEAAVTTATAGAAMDESEALAEAEAQRTLAAKRLQETEQLRQEKVDLERRLTETLARSSPSLEEVTRHPEFVKMDVQLKVEKDDLAREKALRSELEERAKEAASQLYHLKAQHAEESRSTRSQYDERASGLIYAVRSAQEERHETARQRDAYEVEAKRVPSLEAQAKAAADRALHLEQRCSHQAEENRRRAAELARAQEALQGSQERLVDVEKRLAQTLERQSQGGGSSGSAEAETRAQVERLAREAEELRDSVKTKDDFSRALMDEIDNISKELSAQTDELARVQRQAMDSEPQHKKVLEELLAARRDKDLLHRSEMAVRLRHNKAVEAATAAEPTVASLRERLDFLEKQHERDEEERLEMRSRSVKEQGDTDRARGEVAALEADLTHLRRDVSALEARCHELAQDAETARTAQLRAAEQQAQAHRRAEKAQQRLKRFREAAPQGGGSGDAMRSEETAMLEEENRELKRQLICSVCQDRRKNVVITRCFHMFCEECVMENLRTRSRKCPACGLPFGQDDYHTVWLT